MVLDNRLGTFADRLPSTRAIDLLQTANLLLSDWASGMVSAAFDRQLLHFAFGHREPVSAFVCQPLALRCDRGVSAADIRPMTAAARRRPVRRCGSAKCASWLGER